MTEPTPARATTSTDARLKAELAGFAALTNQPADQVQPGTDTTAEEPASSPPSMAPTLPQDRAHPPTTELPATEDHERGRTVVLQPSK
jgi:hypothetical protein